MRNLMIILFVLVLVSCAGQQAVPEVKMEKNLPEPPPPAAPRAVEMATRHVEMGPVSGSDAKGTVSFVKSAGGIKIKVRLSGLSPGKHGFHIHEAGDCSDNAKAAGGHLNPFGKPHAGPNSREHHLGDLGNIFADTKGEVLADLEDIDLSFEGDSSILGKTVIVHKGEDDLTTQPSGNSGARIACGVIPEEKKDKAEEGKDEDSREMKDAPEEKPMKKKTNQEGQASDLNVKEFDIVAKQFEFSPEIITVKKGDNVIFHVQSADVDHGLKIVELGVNKVIPAGKSVDIEFVASRTGTFAMACSVFCGEGHKEMKGLLIVE